MGFYFKKSLKAGPFRFNFSKSGIGISAGIKGFRIGTGPRGNYVHAGRGGFYYRASLSSSGLNEQNQRRNKIENIVKKDIPKLEEIESGNVLEMTDSSAASLLDEINEKHKRISFMPIIAIGGVIAFFFSLSQLPVWATCVITALTIVAVIYAKFYDDLKKSVILFYELDSELEKIYQELHDKFERMMSCGKVWRIGAMGHTNDWKHNAGADSLVRRKKISLSKGQPSYIKTNISVPIIPLGEHTLYFFPERILVFEKEKVGAVPYESLNIEISQTKFIETEGVPLDSKIIDQTWKYVNKKGGPDRRFKDNCQLPVALYEAAYLQSNSGLNELIYFSKVEVAEPFYQVIQQLVKLSSANK